MFLVKFTEDKTFSVGDVELVSWTVHDTEKEANQHIKDELAKIKEWNDKVSAIECRDGRGYVLTYEQFTKLAVGEIATMSMAVLFKMLTA